MIRAVLDSTCSRLRYRASGLSLGSIFSLDGAVISTNFAHAHPSGNSMSPVNLVVLGLHFLDGERAPPILFRIFRLALSFPVALLELRKMFRHERPVFLRDPRYIRSRVKHPHRLGWLPFRKKHHVRLCAGAV